MAKKFIVALLVVLMASGCAQPRRSGQWSVAPQPAPSSYRCTQDGRPVPPGAVGPGTGWCTPNGSTPGSNYNAPGPYNTPYYGS